MLKSVIIAEMKVGDEGYRVTPYNTQNFQLKPSRPTSQPAAVYITAGQEVDGNLVENAKEGVEDAVEGVKEAVKKVTGGDK